jgi:POT family proton-dependent oligopeptide transporter
MDTTSNANFFKTNVLGHPAGLFVLFFTEMWERFSYYGMRVLLVLFLTSAITGFNPGWAWDRKAALALYGTYTSLVYITPILGGWLADNKIGYRMAVVIGALVMTLGHAFMAVETETFLYLGILCLIIGNGFFKPNMTSIISHMYKGYEDKKDGAFTIFYMGVNSGAFLGILLCGYIGEKHGWSWGFGLAGIFMFLGMLQFYFSQPLFGHIGDKPKKENVEGETRKSEVLEVGETKLNYFTLLDKILIVISVLLGVLYVINDPLFEISKMKGLNPINLFSFNVNIPLIGELSGQNTAILIGLIAFIILLVSRVKRYTPVIRDRMIAVGVFAFFTVFFWASFEQAGGSMNIFARDYTGRALVGNSAIIFKFVNTLLTIIPLGIITWVLVKLFKQTFSKIAISNIILGFSFAIIWGIVLWMLYLEFSKDQTEITASWFNILNSLFIITLAPLFSKWWESKYNPSASVKYGLGLILLGLGFGFLAFGSKGIPQGAMTAAVSIIWLVFAYLFHTLGELCLSPVGLSYVSKLVPGRMIAIMFGVWYIAIAIGNKLAGTMGGMIDDISTKYSMSQFFLIFTLIPVSVGILAMLLNPILKKLMHGVR